MLWVIRGEEPCVGMAMGMPLLIMECDMFQNSITFPRRALSGDSFQWCDKITILCYALGSVVGWPLILQVT